MKPNYEEYSTEELQNLLRKDVFGNFLSDEEVWQITSILSSHRSVPLDARKSWLNFLKRFYPEKYKDEVAQQSLDTQT